VASHDSKWSKGVSPDRPTAAIAARVLEGRLLAVWNALPLAAEESEDNVEYVHQLRIATRRGVEALRVFSTLIPDALYSGMRARLRRVRRAADGARNMDVLLACFFAGPAAASAAAAALRAEVERRRQAAQQPIVAVSLELSAEAFDRQIEALVEEVRAQRGRKAKRPFGRQARRLLRPAVRKFFKASTADLADVDSLHRLRLCLKKLRYTMEIVAVAFEQGFRKKLYPRIKLLQGVMGTVNDHAMAAGLFGQWAAAAQDPWRQAFLEGFLAAEAKAHRDLREAFQAMCTPKTLGKLRRQFRMYCGVP